MDFEPIPGPRGLPFLGNILDVQHEEAPLKALCELADKYGPIYRLNIRGMKIVVVSGAEMVKELMDEKKYLRLSPLVLPVDPNKPAGLFTAPIDSLDWGQAHRVLLPAFGPLSVVDMHPEMQDITNQMVLRWARRGPEMEIDVNDDFTRLTLDIIGSCLMDFRFNSFYQDEPHPFVKALKLAFSTAMTKYQRPRVIDYFYNLTTNEVADAYAAVDTMNDIAHSIIQYRRAHPVDKKDFLNTMLFEKDPKTGEVMRDELVVENMRHFLIAGHETTASMMAFAIYQLLKHPEAYKKVQEEVDRVCGREPIGPDQLKQLKYLDAAFRETMRMSPSAPRLNKKPINPNNEIRTLGGKYKIENDDILSIPLGKAQSDPAIFGPDAHEFKPERMMEENNPHFFEINNYWRAFGNGLRSCIGRAFAMQESMLGFATMFQHFDFRLANPDYQLKIQHMLSVKPRNFKIKATLRHGTDAPALNKLLYAGSLNKARADTLAGGAGQVGLSQTDLTIMYGSNAGTCQSLSRRLAGDAANAGFTPAVCEMDSVVGRLSTEHPQVIITTSYEGEPPDNALQFVTHLQSLQSDALKGVRFAIFGCGHRDWAATFHRQPKLVRDLMVAKGATPITDLGLSDVSLGNVMTDFETWTDSILMPALLKSMPGVGANKQANTIEADVSTMERASTLSHDVSLGTVKDVRTLTAPGEPQKKHMEIALPQGTTYECGDYLAVLPQNPEINVRAVMAHFKLPWDATIKLKSKSFAPLPLNTSLSINDLLTNFFELAQPATKRGVTLCAKYTTDESLKSTLTHLAEDSDAFQTQITNPRVSIFDLLQDHPLIKMPLPDFLSQLVPLSIRQYSISSSPLEDPATCTITYAIVTSQGLPRSDIAKHAVAEPTKTEGARKDSANSIEEEHERPKRAFYGVSTNYLSRLIPGERVQVSVRKTASPLFRLPDDQASTPIIMCAAGTGYAPFRGFIQQRAMQAAANPSLYLAPAILYLGCRSQTADRIYASELDDWVNKGIVDVRYAFSRESDKTAGSRYVQDRMQRDGEELMKLWTDGARTYMCGARVLADGVKAAVREMVMKNMKVTRTEGMSEEKVVGVKEEFLERIMERSASDIFD